MQFSTRYWEYIERVQRAATLDAARDITAEFARTLGFRNHGYALKPQERPAGAQAADGVFHFHDFDSAWSDTYRALANPEFQRTDPRVMQARAGYPAAAWDRHGRTSYEPPSLYFKRRIRSTTQVASEFGLGSGITVPSWSPGTEWSFLTLTSEVVADPKELASTIPASVYFTSCLQATVDRLQSRRRGAPHLSLRESETLRWSAIGKTSWEISMILGISERTVNFHLAHAAAKLQVKGRRAACARAIALGVIAI